MYKWISWVTLRRVGVLIYLRVLTDSCGQLTCPTSPRLRINDHAIFQSLQWEKYFTIDFLGLFTKTLRCHTGAPDGALPKQNYLATSFFHGRSIYYVGL